MSAGALDPSAPSNDSSANSTVGALSRGKQCVYLTLRQLLKLVKFVLQEVGCAGFLTRTDIDWQRIASSLGKEPVVCQFVFWNFEPCHYRNSLGLVLMEFDPSQKLIRSIDPEREAGFQKFLQTRCQRLRQLLDAIQAYELTGRVSPRQQQQQHRGSSGPVEEVRLVSNREVVLDPLEKAPSRRLLSPATPSIVSGQTPAPFDVRMGAPPVSGRLPTQSQKQLQQTRRRRSTGRAEEADGRAALLRESALASTSTSTSTGKASSRHQLSQLTSIPGSSSRVQRPLEGEAGSSIMSARPPSAQNLSGGALYIPAGAPHSMGPQAPYRATFVTNVSFDAQGRPLVFPMYHPTQYALAPGMCHQTPGHMIVGPGGVPMFSPALQAATDPREPYLAGGLQPRYIAQTALPPGAVLRPPATHAQYMIPTPHPSQLYYTSSQYPNPTLMGQVPVARHPGAALGVASMEGVGPNNGLPVSDGASLGGFNQRTLSSGAFAYDSNMAHALSVNLPGDLPPANTGAALVLGQCVDELAGSQAAVTLPPATGPGEQHRRRLLLQRQPSRPENSATALSDEWGVLGNTPLERTSIAARQKKAKALAEFDEGRHAATAGAAKRDLPKEALSLHDSQASSAAIGGSRERTLADSTGAAARTTVAKTTGRAADLGGRVDATVGRVLETGSVVSLASKKEVAGITASSLEARREEAQPLKKSCPATQLSSSPTGCSTNALFIEPAASDALVAEDAVVSSPSATATPSDMTHSRPDSSPRAVNLTFQGQPKGLILAHKSALDRAAQPQQTPAPHFELAQRPQTQRAHAMGNQILPRSILSPRPFGAPLFVPGALGFLQDIPDPDAFRVSATSSSGSPRPHSHRLGSSGAPQQQMVQSTDALEEETSRARLRGMGAGLSMGVSTAPAAKTIRGRLPALSGVVRPQTQSQEDSQ